MSKTTQMTKCHINEIQELNKTLTSLRIILPMVPLYKQPHAYITKRTM